jgi:NTE family protein
MSIPGALPPVFVDGQELVDGGIAANLPIGIARELGAQRIIAVDISSPLLDEDGEQFDSFMSVFTHLNSLLTASNRDRDVALLTPRDVLIVPDLGDISFVSFDRATDAIEIGEKTARESRPDLEKFSASKQRWAAFEQRERARALAPLQIDRIRLENTSRVDDRLVRKAMRIDPPEDLDPQTMIFDLLSLYNSHYFGVISFEIDEVEPEINELKVDLPRPLYGPGSLQFGLGIADDFDGDSNYHLLVRHQYLPVNRHGGEWETLVQLGTVGGVSTSFYQPLDWGMRWFVEPSLSFAQGVQEIWLGGQAFAEYEFKTADARLAAGRVLGRWGEIRLAAFTNNNSGSPRIGSPEFSSVDERRAGGQVDFRIDTENSVVFPESGAQMDLRYRVSSESLGSETDFEQFRGSASYALTLGKNTFLPYIEYADNLDPIESFFSAYFLGGLFRLSGLGSKELFGEKVAFARVVAYRRLFSFNVAGSGVKIYAGLSLEAGNAFFAGEPISWGAMRKGGNIFIGGDTFIGPVIFAYGRTDGNRDRFFLAIGDQF